MPRRVLLALPCVFALACASPKKSAPSNENAPADGAAAPGAGGAAALDDAVEEELEAPPPEPVGGESDRAMGPSDYAGGPAKKDSSKPGAPAPVEGGAGGGAGGLDVRVPAINGGLHRDIIRRTAGTHEGDIRGCVPPALAANPALADTLILELDYEGDGKVSSAKVPDGSPFTLDAVEDCVRELAEGWVFDAPEDGKGGSLTVEIRLQ